ncbi:MAG: M23 family metallopeptidase [Pseudomonadota bacterium]
MNIILVSDSLAKGRVITLGRSAAIAAAAALLSLSVMVAAAAYYFALSRAGNLASPYLPSALLSAQQKEAAKNRAYMQDSLNAMAARLGQLQAQMLRLDALGERLVKQSGLPEKEFNFREAPGRGGAESGLPQVGLSFDQFQRELEKLAHQLDARTDQLSVVEAMVLRERVKKHTLPTVQPVSTGWYSSNFGWRLDPFTGKQAFHDGVDFMADPGTPIKAAAGGVVIYSDSHPGYGKMLEIDHGNGLVSRYAHASKLLVKVGDVVLQGQKVAEVGNTGRSTGPHLHFEVLYKGAPQNPARYLSAS